MLNHGLSTGALFLLVGMIYERRHTRQIADFGGLWKPMPRYAAVFLLVTFSSVGLPGLNGFVGEFLILLGAFGASRLATVVRVERPRARRGLHAVDVPARRLRPVRHEENATLEDLRPREIAVLGAGGRDDRDHGRLPGAVPQDDGAVGEGPGRAHGRSTSSARSRSSDHAAPAKRAGGV